MSNVSTQAAGKSAPAPIALIDQPVANDPAVRKVRQELEDFFENAPVPMHLVNASGIILRANRAELQLLGYTKEEYVGRHIAEFHASQAAIDNILTSLTRGDTLDKHPAKLRAKDGSIKQVLICSSANFESGKLVNTRCVTFDVTDFERTQTALIEKEWRSSAVLEALPAAIYTTDAAGKITFYNDAAVQMWGFRPTLGESEFCGSWKLYWPDGTPLPHDQCPMAMALKEQRPIRGLEAIAERPDGTRIPFAPYPTPLFDMTGKLVGAVNMLVDLSDRKADEASRNLLSSIVQSSEDAIVSKNLDGIVTSWNASAERLFGYLAAEIIGKPVLMLIPPEREDEEPLILERIQRGERIDHYETVRRRKNGSLVEVSLTVSPIRSGGKVVGASKIARDISDKKRAEERMLLLAREVDHRANNLLAVAQAAIQLSKAETADGMKTAIAGRVRALGHAHNLLSASRWAGADLRKLIEDELTPYSKSEGHIQIDGEPQTLKPDLAQSLALAIHELATNAAKYGALSSANGRLHVGWSRVSDGLLLRWSESGGPQVEQPTKSGFGTVAINRMFRDHLNGEIHFDWKSEGLVCEITFPVQ